MIRELDVVILTRAVPEVGLEEGDIGAVVMDYEGRGYEVEFVATDGTTIALLTLEPGDIRPVGEREAMHARALAH